MLEELWGKTKQGKDTIDKYLVNANNIIKEGGQEELQLVVKNKLDKDRCSFVWKELYCQHYKSDFWKDTEWNKYKEGITNSYEVLNSKSSCRFSGDVLFSFKSEMDGATGRGKKYEHYFKLISDDSELSEAEKECYLELLFFCNYMNYSLHNMGLMPVDGNLQAVKEKDWDRLDKYIFLINEYFIIEDKEKADLIKKLSTAGPYPERINNETNKTVKEEMINDLKDKRKAQIQSVVQEVLNKFEVIAKENGIEDVKEENGVNIKAGTILYCKEMYLIDNNDFLSKLIKNGSQPIMKGSDVANYMELAIEYWLIKDKILKGNRR